VFTDFSAAEQPTGCHQVLLDGTSTSQRRLLRQHIMLLTESLT